jgi:hypothetical protein
LERARNAKHEGVIVVVAFSLRYPHFAIRQTKMARSYSLFFLTLSARAQRSAAEGPAGCPHRKRGSRLRAAYSTFRTSSPPPLAKSDEPKAKS